ncbi:putative signal transducing protein [Chitinophaga vietnamensis]|uniref:putative signal transducing protein n=1 Tax=Chitinophaga vietnamensis TaxID=2593957 RepID=UPI001177DF1B|nr:DUF2007 domain-containing protein [Chitinophaga vietnamensis]
MEKDWVKVFSSDRAFEAEVVKGMLQEHDIHVVLINKQSSAFSVSLMKQVELYVHPSQAEAARELVAQHENPPMGDTFELNEE